MRGISARGDDVVSRTKTEDIRDLARFGYRQELDRSLGSFSSFAAGFSFISILTGIFQTFPLGFAAAGPAFFWTWPVVLLGQFTVALGFAELAAHYPLSGGVYQWARRIGSPALGWITGWVYLACSLVSLAAVALALQSTLPQITPVFQIVGDGSDPADQARNAVVLGCALIGLTTAINLAGVRLLARINNVGVTVELAGVLILIVLLLCRARRGPEVLLQTRGQGAPGIAGWLGPLLPAAVMPSYVLYGFDTAGMLAEETKEPRQRAPRAILRALLVAGVAGGLLILAGLMAAANPAAPILSELRGGLSFIVKDALGPGLGRALLATVVCTISTCALAVHAGTVRLIFAMARDNSLPFAQMLARVGHETRTPIAPALATGAIATIILLLSINLPRIIETLCSVALVWANLAYLMVSLSLLFLRLRGWPEDMSQKPDVPASASARSSEARSSFALGPWGLPVNLIAVFWGLMMIVNMSWPRAEMYGADPVGRYAAILASLALFGIGMTYYLTQARKRNEILPEHAADARPGSTRALEHSPVP
jgi:urea carboxylase system permease